MRQRTFRSLVAVATAVLVVAAVGPHQQDAQQGPAPQSVTVTIVFQCAGTRSVTPWNARVAQGGEVDWVLDPSSDVTEFEITKKRAMQRWLFQNENSHRGRRDAPARGRQMRSNARGRHAYNIEAPCPGPGGSTRTEVIDPDIIVD